MRISTRRRRSVLGLTLLMTLALLAFPWRSQADIWLPYPGLPEPAVEPASGAWYWVQQAGMSETAKARQWVAVPPLTVASYGGVMPTVGTTEPGTFRQLAVGDAAFVSPPGAPEPYGYMPPMRVRTVGFGLLPAEATIQISQRRTADGKVIPIHAEVDRTIPPDRSWVYPAATVVEDAFDVRVTRVVVDGVDIGLTGECRTVRPAPVRMVAPAFTIPNESQGGEVRDAYLKALGEENFFEPTMGGQVSGTIEIPPFTGCTTDTGDDLSPMLTLSASGPGNRVMARIRPCRDESSGGRPPAPGDWDKYPFAGTTGVWCAPFRPDDVIPYPERNAD